VRTSGLVEFRLCNYGRVQYETNGMLSMNSVKAGSDIHICASCFNLCGINNQTSRSIFSYLPGAS